MASKSKNLKKLFAYDLIVEKEKNYFLIDNNKHNEKFVEIIMKNNDKYRSEIISGKSSKQQLKLMLNAIY